MNTNLEGLVSVVNLIADVASDTAVSLVPGEGLLKKISNYENLLPDLSAFIATIGEIPSEAKDLQPVNYLMLVELLVKRLAISHPRAEVVLEAVFNLLNDIVTIIVPDIKELLVVVRNS